MDYSQLSEESFSLCGSCKYYFPSKPALGRWASFSESYANMGNTAELDEVAAFEILNKYYMLGDRTILRHLRRTPWMSYFDRIQNVWLPHKLPDHGTVVEDPNRIAERLLALLENELKEYVSGKARIGILLSGGMDSRIVAGVLNHLVECGELSPSKIVAYTWGQDDSRDVVYSKRIADLFGWQWNHFQVGPRELWENFVIAGHRGCEFTGFHLHAIPQIAANLEIDVMLAGSYGDSVGRAEYSGRHVSRIVPIADRLGNPAYLMKDAAYQRVQKAYFHDIEAYHRQFPRSAPYAQRELDYQLHYMRRMLNPCMSLIGERVAMYQAFTHPNTFGYMWSLKPECRSNLPYKFILEKLGGGLEEIPWARTGLKYLETTGQPDSFKKQHHRYSEFTQSNLIADIENRIMSHQGSLDTIFNMQSVKKLIRLIKRYKNQNFDYLERLVWLVSFTYFLEKYDVCLKTERLTLTDWSKGNFVLPLQYLAKRTYRTLRSKLR